MIVPPPMMFSMAEIREEHGYTEDELLDLGIKGDLEFLVYIPDFGACYVPAKALSHFLAGAEEYPATALATYYGSATSGDWVIRRNMLRVLGRSWNRWTYSLETQEPLLGVDHFAENIASSEQTEAPERQTTAQTPPSSTWQVRTDLKRFGGYRYELLKAVKAFHTKGHPRPPTAREVLDFWLEKKPFDIAVMSDGIKYTTNSGDDEVTIDSIRKAIKGLIKL
jgi:hypothetical protein